MSQGYPLGSRSPRNHKERSYSWHAFGKKSMEDLVYLRSIRQGSNKHKQLKKSLKSFGSFCSFHSVESNQTNMSGSIISFSDSTSYISDSVSSIHFVQFEHMDDDHSDMVDEAEEELLMSSSLSNAVLQVCETKVKMDQFLQRQSSQLSDHEDDDNMSTEIRMLEYSEEKLARSMNRLEVKVSSIPSLIDPSEYECESQESSLNQSNHSFSPTSWHRMFDVVEEPLTQHPNMNVYIPQMKQELGASPTSDACSIVEGNGDFQKSPLFISRNILKSKSEGFLHTIADLLFGRYEYNTKPILHSSVFGSQRSYCRDIQGSFSICLATFISTFGLMEEKHNLSQRCSSSFLVSTLITFLEVNLPHNIDECNIALGIILLPLLIQSYPTHEDHTANS